MKFRYLAIAILFATGSATFGQDTPPQPANEQQPATAAVPPALVEDEPVEALDDEEGNEVVCRTERLTGSLSRRRRTCMTRNEWAELERASGQGHSANVRNASGSQCIPTDPTRPQC